MKFCDCYRVKSERCWGTKNKDICRCGGDESKCDFYESVREKAITILESTAETREYIESLPKIYMIARWAGCGVQEFPFAGRCDDKGIPFVYVHDDCNGTCDCYFLRKLTNTTTGWIYAWTVSKCRAEEIARALNEVAGESWRND